MAEQLSERRMGWRRPLPALDLRPGSGVAQNGARTEDVKGQRRTHPHKRTMVWLNVLGGSAVIASYAHGLLTNPTTRNDLWGGVPQTLLPFYTIWMFLAAAGYLMFTYFLMYRVRPHEVQIAKRFDLRLMNALYAIVLVPSALWMPLTFAMLEDPNPNLWLAIRLTLAMVGLGSVAFIAALLALRPRRPAPFYWLAVGGALLFAVQTALLDALVWPAFFVS